MLVKPECKTVKVGRLIYRLERLRIRELHGLRKCEARYLCSNNSAHRNRHRTTLSETEYARRGRVTHSSSSNFTFEQPFLGEF